MSELKACDWCDTDKWAGPTVWSEDDARKWQIVCGKCGAAGPACDDAEKAAAAWNRRAPLPVVTREELARLIDPEAFGLPSIVNNLGEDYLTDRDEASAKGDAILALLREKGVVG